MQRSRRWVHPFNRYHRWLGTSLNDLNEVCLQIARAIAYKIAVSGERIVGPQPDCLGIVGILKIVEQQQSFAKLQPHDPVNRFSREVAKAVDEEVDVVAPAVIRLRAREDFERVGLTAPAAPSEQRDGIIGMPGHVQPADKLVIIRTFS